jgi:hypothetical protein
MKVVALIAFAVCVSITLAQTAEPLDRVVSPHAFGIQALGGRYARSGLVYRVRPGCSQFGAAPV